jgi:hypothetical protein
MEVAALQDALMAFVASIPHGSDSREAALYRSTATDCEVRLAGAQQEFEIAKGRGGKAGLLTLGRVGQSPEGRG